MKVVHISTYRTGGAGIAAYRLHEALNRAGIESFFLTLDKVPEGEKQTATLNWPTKSLLQRVVNKMVRLLPWQNSNKAEEAAFKEELNILQPGITSEIVSLPFSGYNMLSHSFVKQADIIHLHWVAGMLDYKRFFAENKKPVVWTLHDMNPVLGLFHYEGDATKNSAVTATLNEKVFRYKAAVLSARQAALHFVTPSDWLLAKVSQSEFFKSIPMQTIANTIGEDWFMVQDKNMLRREMNIPIDNTVLLFVSEKVDNYRKGFDLLLEALTMLKDLRLTIFVVGDNAAIDLPLQDVRLLGLIKDPKTIKTYYSVADIFIIPSREDNLPNVMLESMACGTPVLSFNTGGMAAIIEDGFNGIKAKQVTALALAETIRINEKTKEGYNGNEIRAFAQRSFSNSRISKAHIDLYNSMVTP